MSEKLSRRRVRNAELAQQDQFIKDLAVRFPARPKQVTEETAATPAVR